MKKSFWFSRFFFLRALGLIYLLAFLVVVRQYIPLVGSDGILPLPDFLLRIQDYYGSSVSAYWELPTLFWIHHSDTWLQALGWTGVILSLLLLAGYANGFILFILWGLYLSFVNGGQLFYGYGWESLLLETGFLAIFLVPLWKGSPFPRTTPPSPIVLWLMRWVLFRVMFGAAMIKLRGDSCWVDLTCLNYHFETQPIPNPLSPFFHFLPEWALKGGVLFNHFAELVAPLLILLTRWPRLIGGVVIAVFQLILILSGNLSWLNYLTLALCIPCFDDKALRFLIPKKLKERISQIQEGSRLATSHRLAIYALAGLVAFLSIHPILNLISPQQAMNRSYDPFHIVNTYGAFGSVTKVRREVILEGTGDQEVTDQTKWKAYEFKCKPGDVHRRPCILSPYHLRLDWQIWFSAFSHPSSQDWLLVLMQKLLQGDPKILALMGTNPFPDQPPEFIRAQLYEYHFNDPWGPSPDVWRRRYLGPYFPPFRLKTKEYR